MRFGWRYAASALALALAFVPAHEARAEENEILHVFEGIGVAAAIVGDVVFTTYDVATASKGKQPDKAWMVAQTALAAPETVVTYVVIIADAEDPDFIKRAPLVLPLGIAASSLATHSIWSVATDHFPPAPRLGASWLLGADLTFTALSISETINGKLLPKSLGLVEGLLMTPEAVLGAYEAVKDSDARGGWIGIAGWSGVLATHGILSFLVGVANVQPVPKAPPNRGMPPPPPAPEDDQPPENAPAPSGEPVPAAPTPPDPSTTPPTTSKAKPIRPVVIPATLSDGYRMVPGALVVGVF